MSLAWKSVQGLAAQGSADQLMELAAQRSGSLHEKSLAFSEAVRGGSYVPLQGAVLLAELGEQIKFGALVSGIFSKNLHEEQSSLNFKEPPNSRVQNLPLTINLTSTYMDVLI